MLAAAAPAQATIYAVAPADFEGPEDSFTTMDSLWVIGTSNPVEGAAQVCVVEASVTSGNCSEIAFWGSPNVISFMGTYHQPIEAPALPVGTYRILADNDDDPFDDNQGDIVSQPFTVSPCTGDACNIEVGLGVVQEWKATAAGARHGAEYYCSSAIAYRIGGLLSGGSGTLSSGQREMILADIKGDDEDLELKKPTSSRRQAIGFLRKVACGTYLMYDDIVKDPPDPDYKHVTEADPDNHFFQLTAFAEVNTAAATFEDVRANGVAHRVGFERHQGAVEADDEGWAAFHAGRLGEQALVTQHRMRRLGRELRAAAPKLEDPAIDAATPEDLDKVADVRERVRTSGFRPGELAQLDALGLSDADVAELRAQLGAPLPDVIPTEPDDALLAAADEIDKATCIDDGDLCGFDAMARTASAVGADTATPPTIGVGDVAIREGDHGINHARVAITLSHPSLHGVHGNWSLDEGDTAEDELTGLHGAMGGVWGLPEERTRTHATVIVDNDTAEEADETAHFTVTMSGGNTSEPAAVTVLDDDGAGDPPKPVRGARGMLAWISPRPLGPTLMMAEPDGTNVTEVDTRAAYGKHQVVDWSPDGRLLLIQYVPSDLSDQGANGQRLSTVRIGEDGSVLGAPVELTPKIPLVGASRFSPDSAQVLTSRFDGGGGWNLAVQDVNRDGTPAGALRRLDVGTGLAGWYSTGGDWSPSGDRIVFGGCEPGSSADCGTFTVGLDADREVVGTPAPLRLRTDPNDVWVTHPTWSPDGRFVADLAGPMSAPLLQRTPVTAAGVTSGPPLAVSGSGAGGGMWASAGDWAPDSGGIAFATARDPLTGEPGNQTPVVRSLDADGEPVGALQELQPHGWPSGSIAWARLPDETPPATTAEVTPEANAAGWHREDVTVRLTADDPGLGSVDHIAYSVGGAAARVDVDGDQATVAVTGEGTRVLRYRAYDVRGNAEPERTLTLRIDRTEPAVTIQSPAGAHEVGSRVVAAYTCSDAGSGIAACAGDASAGAALGTGTPGAQAFSVTATDKAGNEASGSSAWSVVPRAAEAGRPPDPPAGAPPSTAAATLPSSRRCVSRRRFRIRLRAPRGDPLTSARVFVNGKRVKVLRGNRLTAPIDLRGLPKGRFRVKVTATTRSGRALTSTRKYRTCAKQRRPRR